MATDSARGEPMADDEITQAAQLIAQGDFMGAMQIFESYSESNPDDPVGFHGWAEAALFEIQVNGNLDGKGNDRINEGQIAAYYRRASSMDPKNPEYLASYAKALLEFDRISMSVREFRKLKALGEELDDLDVSSHFYEAAKTLIDLIDLKTEFDRSNPNARQFIPVALEFAMLGLGFSSTDEAMEYLVAEQ